ncbi:MAG: 5'/3'-nucleotidase SurE [Gemmatimonadota bacterium]|jgi:5'-nucleotidase
MLRTTRRADILLARACAAAAACLALGAAPGTGQVAGSAPPFPARVLITNDNGIDDPKVVALARGFARHAEVWVFAPAAERSGSGSYLTITRVGAMAAEPRDLGPGIRAFAVDGFPADCVLLALLGPMKDSPPDLVVSGINGGANLGSAWFASGTVGAARTAALAGLPAIAVSGLDDDIPGAVEAAVDWVVRLAASPAVRDLRAHEFLTVSLPQVAPDSVAGVRVADRAPLRVVPRLEPAGDGSWRVVGSDELAGAPPPGSDEAVWNDRFIAIVPMRADEVDFQRLAVWRRLAPGLPAWRQTDPGAPAIRKPQGSGLIR